MISSAISACFEYKDGEVHGNRFSDRSRPWSTSPSDFRCLVDQYAPKVQTVLYAVLGDRQTAEAVSISVFARAYRTLRSSTNPWLDLIRLSIAECRRVRCAGFFGSSSAVPRDRGHTATKTTGTTTADSAVRLLSILSWKERILLVLREVAELSPEQMAAILDSTPRRVKSELLGARQALLKASKT